MDEQTQVNVGNKSWLPRIHVTGIANERDVENPSLTHARSKFLLRKTDRLSEVDFGNHNTVPSESDRLNREGT
jgi:hypothetical protein